MSITIRYFASVREKLGAGEQLVLGDTGARTVGELRQWLRGRSALHADALDPDKCLRTACNQTLCDADAPLLDGAEVAFFPPVTGG